MNFPRSSIGMTAIIKSPIQTGISRKRFCGQAVSPSPETSEQIGSIIAKSIKFAPIIFPTDSEDCFFITALIVVTSSGSEVPTATIVAEITASETPLAAAISVAESTRKSAPITIPAAPIINFTMLSGISFFSNTRFSFCAIRLFRF